MVVTDVMVRAARAAEPDANLATAREAARALERWGSRRGWSGPDPYDALNGTRLPRIVRRSPLALRAATQAVKRSPWNLRPVLGVPDGVSAATLARVLSAYARDGFLDPGEARAKLRHYVDVLATLRCATFPEPCWGYHFDVQTRVFFYPSTSPNTIATAFAGLGLLDAYELAGLDDALELAAGAGDFFLRHVPQTPAGTGAYFGYLAGDDTPIHNANMLVAALLARLATATGRADFDGAARAAVRYTVTHQRPDGAWPYGERGNLGWVDGFHTGYVLDSLLTCIETGLCGASEERAWRRGLRYYVDALIDPDGAPRYSSSSRFPIDGQSAAQALLTLARAAPREPELADRRWSVLDFALRELGRSDGAFAFQRDRYSRNRIAHPRWVEAPMLEALAHLLAAGRRDPTASTPTPPRPTLGRARTEDLVRHATSTSAPVRAVIKSAPVQRVIQTERAARVVYPGTRFIAAQVTRRPVGRYTLHSGLVVHLRHNSRDIDMLNEIFAKRCYEPPPGPVAEALQASDSVRVLDLGGNVGLFAAYALGRWEASQVRSFEPDPDNAGLLRSTIAANSGTSAWRLEEKAVSNRAGALAFVPGRLSESRIAHAGEPAVHVPTVDLYDIDHDVDLLKMDIEGGEWPILTDPRLPSLSARTIVMEWHARFCPSSDPHAMVRDLLLAADYEIVRDQVSPHALTGLLWVTRGD
jgi:FkbM family methyltransferase